MFLVVTPWVGVRSQGACAAPIRAILNGHTRNWTQIYLAALTVDSTGVRMGAAARLTTRPGYNHQPAFTPDGRGMYYTWRADSAEADIWFHDLSNGTEYPVTCTSEDEYSAAPVPGGSDISVVRVENDSVRRLWIVDGANRSLRVLFPSLRTVAYYAWMDAVTIALYVTSDSAPGGSSLGIGDVRSGSVRIVASGIGSTLAKLPTQDAISYLDIRDPVHPRLMELDARSHVSRFIVALPDAASDYTWLPDHSILASVGQRIFRWTERSRTWVEIADLRNSSVGDIRRFVASPGGDHLAIVVQTH